MAALLGPLVGHFVGKSQQAGQIDMMKKFAEYKNDMRMHEFALKGAIDAAEKTGDPRLWDDVSNIFGQMQETTESSFPGAKKAVKEGQLGNIGEIGSKVSQLLKQRQQQQKQQAQQQAINKAYAATAPGAAPGQAQPTQPNLMQFDPAAQKARAATPAAPAPATPVPAGGVPGAAPPPAMNPRFAYLAQMGKDIQGANQAAEERTYQLGQTRKRAESAESEKETMTQLGERTKFFQSPEGGGMDPKSAREAAFVSVFGRQPLPAQGAHNMTQVLYKKPGSEELNVGWADPRDPGKVFDAATGTALEQGQFTLVDKSLAGAEERAKYWGEFGRYYQAARGQGLSDEQARKAAGDMVYKHYGVQIGRQEQQIAIDRTLSGIGAGSGVPKSALPNMPPSTLPGTGGGSTRPTTPAPSAIPRQPAQASTVQTPFGKLTQQQSDDVLYYLSTLTGTSGGRGGGKAGQVRAQEGLRIIAKQTGLDPMTLTARLTETPALAKQIGETVQRSGAIQRLNNTIDTHGKILLDVAQKLKDTGSPLLNRPVREWSRLAVSDPDFKRAQVALNEIQREYAYLTAGGAQSRAMLPVHTSESMDKILSLDSTLPEMAAEVQQIGVGAKAELQAMNKTVQDLQQQMISGPAGQATGAPQRTSPPPATGGGPKPTNAADYLKSIGMGQ